MSSLCQTLVFLHFLLFLLPDPALLGDHHIRHYTLLVHFVHNHSGRPAGRHQLFFILILEVQQDLSLIFSQMFLYTVAATLL